MKPRGEMVIIACEDTKAFGAEIKSDAGIILGRAEDRENLIPAWGKIVEKGSEVPDDVSVVIGDTVLLPDSTRYQKVYEPRVVSGELPRNSKDQLIYITTHYKNISIIYK